MPTTMLLVALLAPGQGREYDWDTDREVVNYSRVRDRGFDRRSGYSGGGYVPQPVPYYGGGGDFNAQFRGSRGGYANVQGSFGRGGYSGGYVPPDPFAGTFEFDARFRREPRAARFPLLRFLLCGPEREPRFRGEVTIRRR